MGKSKARKKRNLLRKNWAPLRAEIERIISEESIDTADFRALSIWEEWETIQRKIYETFCGVKHYKKASGWLWENFKLGTTSLSLREVPRHETLLKLVDPQEKFWFFINETINEKTKFWFYEANLAAVLKIIEESSVDEYYLVSKKYNWLICENHHEVLFVTEADVLNELSTM